MGGFLGDSTPFLNNDINEYFESLKNYGYEKYGDEILYSGITGDQIHTNIFIGPTYYQRLKIMVEDKMYSRATGPLQHMVRQPAAGRSQQGGLRIGEMERDAIIAYGTSDFLQESMMKRSDAYNMNISETSGMVSYDKNNKNICNIELPYSTKLFLQELQTMSIVPRLNTNTNDNNISALDHLMKTVDIDNYELIDDDNDYDEISDEED